VRGVRGDGGGVRRSMRRVGPKGSTGMIVEKELAWSLVRKEEGTREGEDRGE